MAILIPNSEQFESYKEVRDKDRRYVLVEGKLENKVVTIVNAYAPLENMTCFSNTYSMLLH